MSSLRGLVRPRMRHTSPPPLLPKLFAPGRGELFPMAVHVVCGEGHVVLLASEAQSLQGPAPLRL
eukprot:5643574-Pyramimonas_sp.AAC.1